MDEAYRSTVFGGLGHEDGRHIKQNTTQELIPRIIKARFLVTSLSFAQKC